MSNFTYKNLKEFISIEELRSLVEYDHITGLLYWKERGVSAQKLLNMTQKGLKTFNTRYAGKPIGGSCGGSHGYTQLQMMVDGVKITCTQHFVCYALFYNRWPSEGKVLDHINRIRTDNRIINLREVSPTGNVYNTPARADNTSGRKGVSYKKDKSKWKAFYNFEGKQYHLGYFDDFESAVNARDMWEMTTDEYIG